MDENRHRILRKTNPDIADLMKRIAELNGRVAALEQIILETIDDQGKDAVKRLMTKVKDIKKPSSSMKVPLSLQSQFSSGFRDVTQRVFLKLARIHLSRIQLTEKHPRT